MRRSIVFMNSLFECEKGIFEILLLPMKKVEYIATSDSMIFFGSKSGTKSRRDPSRFSQVEVWMDSSLVIFGKHSLLVYYN